MIDEKLLSNIIEFCVINNIEDIKGTVNSFLLTGFNIAKYGNTPFDNSKKEKKETHVIDIPKEILIEPKEELKVLEEILPIKEEIVKPKKTIRVIKNK